VACRTLQLSRFEIFGHNVYAICGDGDIMEGVGSEAASLARPAAAHLCWIYDANSVTLDGRDWSFSEDVAAARGYGWNTTMSVR
jgi:transketolase